VLPLGLHPAGGRRRGCCGPASAWPFSRPRRQRLKVRRTALGRPSWPC